MGKQQAEISGEIKWGFLPWALLAVALFSYFNSWRVPFLFDDNANILSKVSIHNVMDIPALWAENVKTRFLPYFSFALNFFFNKEQVFGYHLFNFCMHVFNALWVYLLVLLLFRTPKMRDTFPEKAVNFLATFSALIFLSHPLQTQAVTYIVQRMASMAAFFYLGAIVFYLRSRLDGKKADYVCAFFMTVAAMFCKENAFTLPLAIALVEGMFFGSPKGERLKAFGRMVPFFLTMVIIPAFIWEGNKDIASNGFLPVQKKALPRWEYFLTELNVMRTYLRLLFFPVNQTLDYDYPTARSLFELRTLCSFLLLSGLVAAAFRFLKKYRLLAFGIFWFFLTLSVESSFIPIDDVIYEHRMYLPMAGCAIFVSVALYLFLEKLNHFIAAGAVVVLVFSSLTYARNEVWKTHISLWSDVIKKAPHKARGYNNLARAYSMRDGKSGKALGYLEKAIALDPQDSQVYYNLGVIYDNRGDRTKAKSLYEKAIEIDPEYLSPMNNLAAFYIDNNELVRAIEILQKAIKISPSYVVGYDSLGVAYRKAGNILKSIESFEKAIRVNPYYPSAYLHLGMVLNEQGDAEKASELFRKAGELGPNYPDVVFETGKFHAQKGETEKAKEAVMKLKRMRETEMALVLEKILSEGTAWEGSKAASPMRRFLLREEDSKEMSEEEKKIRENIKRVMLVQKVQRMNQTVRYAAARPTAASQPVSPVAAVRSVKGAMEK